MSPPNWPSSVEFLYQNRWAEDVSVDVKLRYISFSHDAAVADIDLKRVKTSRGSSDKVEIRWIDRTTHPAYGERGLFAAERIRPFSFILDYLGTINYQSKISPDLLYTLAFHDDLSISAAQSGNEARFINDYHNIAERPNAAFDTYRDTHTGEVRVGVWTLNQWIEIGEEITVPYGSEFWGTGVKEWDPAWDEGEEYWAEQEPDT